MKNMSICIKISDCPETLEEARRMIDEQQEQLAKISGQWRELIKLVKAVNVGGYDGTYCEDVGAENWFDMRRRVLANKVDMPFGNK